MPFLGAEPLGNVPRHSWGDSRKWHGILSGGAIMVDRHVK